MWCVARVTCLVFNSYLREGAVLVEWKTASIIPLTKKTAMSIEKYIRPMSLTPLVANVIESIIMKWIDEQWIGKSIKNKLVEMAEHQQQMVSGNVQDLSSPT